MDRRHPVLNPKRSIGPIEIVADADDATKPMIVLRYNGEEKHFTPHHISSMMVIEEKQVQEYFQGIHSLKTTTFIVPAYFDHYQLLATYRAWVFAGVTKIYILQEPIAAAVAYRPYVNPSRNKETVFVFNLGAASLEVSLLLLQERCHFSVKYTSGQTHLGGEDFTNRLLNFLVAEFRMKHKKDISTNPRALRRLRDACEKAKRALSSNTLTTIEIDSFFEGVDFFSVISRSRFEELNIDLFNKCIQLVDNFLGDKEIDTTEINHVVLSGGSSWIPRLQELLQDLFYDKELHKDIPPEAAVTAGAIYLAESVNHKEENEEEETFQEEQLLPQEQLHPQEQLLPLSVGIATTGGIMSVLIPMNTRIPTKKDRVFSTESDYQTSMLIQLYQGESVRTKHNYFLGTFELKGIPPAPRGVPRIKVCFHVKAKGIIRVSAYDMTSGNKITVTGNTGTVSEEQIEMMLQNAEEGYIKKKMRARNCLKNYVCDMRNTIQKIEKEIVETIAWVDTDLGNVDEYEDKLKELQGLWDPIVERLNSLIDPEA